MINLFAAGLVLIGAVIGAFGALLLKKGSRIVSLTNLNLVLGILLYGVSAIFYLVALKREDLSILYPLVSIGYVWVCLLSVYFLKEKMNLWKWFGIVIIIIGVSFIGIGS